jgi:hypothetical protein
MIELDRYSLKARLYPAFIVLLPAFVVSLFYITDFEKYYHYATALVSVGLFTYLLAQLGRDKGKINEVKLFTLWGGKPTTIIFRHNDNTIDPVTKNRYHKLLTEKIDGIQIPTPKQEQNDKIFADQVYESCTKFLISKTRNTKKFPLIFNENISYGFRRNLWGMKFWALAIISILIIIHFYFITGGFKTKITLQNKDIFLFLFFGLVLLFWFFIVTKNWIKLTAYAYAERLIESINEL